MPALDVPPRHSTLGRVITGLMAFTVLWGLFVGVHPQPSPRVQMVMLLAMALLTVAALWLRRRDRCAYERRLAREAAARAVVEDRLVIARELHDAVSGNLGAITVRCAVAQRLETSPDGLRHALRDVESASREATDGLRRMLAVLRDEGAAAHGIPDPTGASGMAGPVRAAGSASPAGLAAAGPAGPARAAGAPGGPGDRMIRPARGAPAGAGAPHGAGTAGAAVAASWRGSGIGAGDPDSALAGAVTRARRAGVEVEIDADRGAGPSPMGEAVARVVGEALVNTARHAGPSRARVTVRREFSRLRVIVVDDGPAPGWTPRPGTGQGLRGLRELVEAMGGTLRAGPLRGAGGAGHGGDGAAGGRGAGGADGTAGAVGAVRAGFVVEAVLPLPATRTGGVGGATASRAGPRESAEESHE
ncbi:sensor histidine kinase [Actinomyces gerencseriae]|uniref:sensor histidine kinase n=1 Tax=Actinomyces gerencseriae TaxID=52769 RepID=UPI000688AC6F|nr:histidine kinase [Actinomyces gerencseriae]